MRRPHARPSGSRPARQLPEPVRALWAGRRGLVLAIPAVVLVAWLSGLVLRAAVLVTLALFTGALVLLSVKVPEGRAGFPTRRDDPDGTRSDLAEISWSFDGQGGRVSEAAVRRLRSIAAGRFQRLGLNWDQADDRRRAQALVGSRAWATLTHPGGLMPKVREIEHCVAVLERLPDAAVPPTPALPTPATASTVTSPPPTQTGTQP